MGYPNGIKSAQKRVEDLLAQQYASYEPAAARTKDIILSQRAKNRSGTNIALQKAVSDYGLSAAVGAAAPGEFNRADQQTLNPKLEEIQAQQQLSARRQQITQTFNFAFDNMVQAGMDTQTAYQRAREIALNQESQNFAEQQAQEVRDYRIAQSRAKQSSSFQFAGLNMIKPLDTINEETVAAFLGLGLKGASGLALKDTDTKPVYSFNSTPSSTEGQSLRTGTAYTPYTSPYNTSPYNADSTWLNRYRLSGGY